MTERELIDWIKHVQTRYIWSDTERQWKDFESKDGLTWETYKKRTYGFVDGKYDVCSSIEQYISEKTQGSEGKKKGSA